MQLQVSPDAPAIIQVAAASLLALHIGGAFVGMAAGGVAMIARKGQRTHRAAGNLFFVAMLAMSGVGAAVAPFLTAGQAPNTLMGAFTFYLVATGWGAVRRGPGRTGYFELAASAFAIVLAGAGLTFAWINAHGPHPLPAPEGPVIAVVAGVATLAAVCDIRAILRGGLSGAARIARHLWRMSLALLIAVGSFAGQPKAIPPFLQGSPLLVLPIFAVLALMIFWLVRVRLTRAPRPLAAQQSVPASAG
jgi:uncharacterized membrane protein